MTVLRPGSEASRGHRILFLAYTAERTGPSNSLVLLLTGLRKRGYEPVVVTAEEGPLTEQLRALDVSVRKVRAFTKWDIPAIARLIREVRPAVLYANATAGSARNGFIAARLSRVAFVLHVRAMQHGAGWRRLWYLRGADAVIGVSRAAADSVSRFVRSERLHVVYNGIDVSSTPDPGNSTDPFRGPAAPDGASIAMVGNVSRRKNQVAAVRAIADLARARPGVRLRVAGRLDREPDYVAELRSEIERLGVEENVELLGFRPDPFSILRESDLFLHTALDDPHPRAVLEAMAEGLPVVAYAVDGVAETVVDGETGVLLPPGSSDLATAIDALLRDAPTRDRMGRQGRKRVHETFTAEATADGVARILAGILQGE